MTNPDLINNDPIVARNFFLELPGGDALVLSSVSGLDIELDVVSIAQNGKDGRQQHIKTLGGQLKAPVIAIERMAPLDFSSDPLWSWFLEIRKTGMKASTRSATRRHGSITMYDIPGHRVAQFNFFHGWPSSIKTSSVSTDSNEPMKEQIALECERIERVL